MTTRPMTEKQREAMHRRREREHITSARWFIRNKDYVEASRRLGWALEQASVADAIAGASQRQSVERTTK